MRHFNRLHDSLSCLMLLFPCIQFIIVIEIASQAQANVFFFFFLFFKIGISCMFTVHWQIFAFHISTTISLVLDEKMEKDQNHRHVRFGMPCHWIDNPWKFYDKNYWMYSAQGCFVHVRFEFEITIENRKGKTIITIWTMIRAVTTTTNRKFQSKPEQTGNKRDKYWMMIIHCKIYGLWWNCAKKWKTIICLKWSLNLGKVWKEWQEH